MHSLSSMRQGSLYLTSDALMGAARALCRSFLWALACSALAVLPATAQQPNRTSAPKAARDYEKRYALVIGNSDYKHLPRLGTPRNDAVDMCNTLKKLGFETMCFENQRTKRDMKDAVIRFTEKVAASQGVALVFYAGHGMQVRGENYLIPSGAVLRSEADMDDETLNVNYLMAQLDHSKNPFNIVILDACRNDPISRGWRSAGRGLAPIDAPVGSVIIFSTAPGKAASDGDGRNGLFTKHLLANLNAPGLSLEEMIKQVSRGVMEESSKGGFNQTPWWNSSFTGTFCFGGCIDSTQGNDLTVRRNEKSQLDATTVELVFWDTIKTSSNPIDFDSYLQKYPNGQFVQLARNAINRIEEDRAAELMLWDSIKTSSNPNDFASYLKKYPNSQFVQAARNTINRLEDDRATESILWDSIRTSSNPIDFDSYLKKYPNGQFIQLAKNAKNRLETEKLNIERTQKKDHIHIIVPP